MVTRIKGEWEQETTQELPKLEQPPFPYRLGDNVDFVLCYNPHHNPMRSWTPECSKVLCRYCNPHYATAEGRFILKWMHSDAQKRFKTLVKKDLAAGRIPPPYEGNLDEIEDEEPTPPGM